MLEKINARVESEILKEIDRLASEEKRSRSQMVAILLEEAVINRKKECEKK